MIVSGGVGFSAEQLVRTALAQFPESHVALRLTPQIRAVEQLNDVVEQAAATDAVIIHTLVQPEVRQALVEMARERHVAAIDLIGPLIERLSVDLGQAPLGRPGLYREQLRTYFDRIAAIEYTLAHDDGAHAEGWPEADILLIGVSRAGKTPLAMYLAMLGWKIANLPLVRELALPPELFALNPACVIGLTIGLPQLIEHRQWRQRRLGMPLGAGYTDPGSLSDELEYADRIFQRHGFAVVDVTNKPIESIANEVIARVERYRG